MVVAVLPASVGVTSWQSGIGSLATYFDSGARNPEPYSPKLRSSGKTWTQRILGRRLVVADGSGLRAEEAEPLSWDARF